MRLPLAFIASSLAVLPGCGDTESADAGRDTALPTCESIPPPLSVGDADGHPDPLGADATQARAGRLAVADVPPDPSGLLRWRAGDFVLANDRIAIVIEDIGLSDEFNPWGGQPVGMAAVVAGALVDAADFNEVILSLGRATIETQSVTVINDGRDGEAAVVRAVGELASLGFNEFLGDVVSAGVPGLELAFDYSLAPGAESVEVRVVSANDGARNIGFRQPFLWAFQQNRMPKFGPGGPGFDVEVGTRLPYAAFVEEGATSFAFEPEVGDLQIFLEQSNLLAILLPAFESAACSRNEHLLGRYHIGRPGLDGLLVARGATIAETRHETSGIVRQSDGLPAAGARVHVRDAAGALLTRATTAADGTFVFHTAETAVTISAWRRGDQPSVDLNVTAPSTDVALMFGPTGSLTVRVTDLGGNPIPAFVQAIPMSGAPPSVPAEYGEPRIVRDRTDVRYTIDGVADFRLPAGDYQIVLSRGYEWEMASLDVSIARDTAIERTGVLEQVIDTPDVLCGDFHIHSNRSFDAEDDARLKVRAAVAQGLEIPVRSEHEWVSSFEPLIAEMGLEDEMYSIASLELTTFTMGHFGVFPLDPMPDERNDGALDWIGLDAPTLLGGAEARSGMFGPARVIINHPRSRLSILGYFSAIGYDPDTGTSAIGEAAAWTDFRLIEVFNASDFDANEDSVVRDWFSFLRHGQPVFAVGSSDSHQVSSTAIGYPRTCVEVGVDTPAELRALGAGIVRDRLSDGRATIVGGVFIDALGRGGVRPGGTVSGAAVTESFDVTVRAPSWVTVDRLRVYSDGVLTEMIPIDAGTVVPLEPTTRFSQPVDVTADAFVVFVADGVGDLAPVHPRRRPFGVTNPIFLRR